MFQRNDRYSRSALSKIADPHTGIRRMEIIANKITPNYQQYTLFQDSIKAERKDICRKQYCSEKALWKKCDHVGSNLLECSTYWERNNQVGGHRAYRGVVCWQRLIRNIYIFQRPVSKRYPMDNSDRAKQFASLARLRDLRTSYGNRKYFCRTKEGVIEEQKCGLDRKLQMVSVGMQIQATYFKELK